MENPESIHDYKNLQWQDDFKDGLIEVGDYNLSDIDYLNYSTTYY